MSTSNKRRREEDASSSSGEVPGEPAPVIVPQAMSVDLASLFECTVCFEYVMPPIMQCQSGHLVCSSCHIELLWCPTCRDPLGNNRNLGMEKVASKVMFPCKYTKSGCPVRLLHTEKADHEESCEFRQYKCPLSCKWKGRLEEVILHLKKDHQEVTSLEGQDIVFLATNISSPGNVDWVMIQSCLDHHFMVFLEKQVRSDGYSQFFATVQIIGSGKEAKNFSYQLELRGHRRRLMWQSKTQSIQDGIAKAIKNAECLVFGPPQLFADDDKLSMRGIIYNCNA